MYILGFTSDLDLNSYLLFLFLLHAFCSVGAEIKGRYTFECPTIGELHLLIAASKEWAVHFSDGISISYPLATFFLLFPGRILTAFTYLFTLSQVP